MSTKTGIASQSVVLVVVLGCSLMGCATMSNRTKTVLTMLVAGSVAGTVGAMSAPATENPLAHAALWGGGTAAVAGTVSLFVFDEQAKSRELERQNGTLKKELEGYRMDGGLGLDSSEVAAGAPSFSQDIPEEVKSLMRPGRWKFTRFGPNRWVLKGDGYMVRECAAFQLVAPSLRIPGAAVGPIVDVSGAGAEVSPSPPIAGAVPAVFPEAKTKEENK